MYSLHYFYLILASQSPNHGASDEFVYEGYPDRESPANHTVAIELHPPYAAEEEEQQQQVVGAEDYELEESESEISDSDTEQVRFISKFFMVTQIFEPYRLQNY